MFISLLDRVFNGGCGELLIVLGVLVLVLFLGFFCSLGCSRCFFFPFLCGFE